MTDTQSLSAVIMDRRPELAAKVIATAAPEDASALLEKTSTEVSIKAISSMPSLSAANLIKTLDTATAGSLLSALPLRTATALLRAMDPDPRAAILETLPAPLARSLAQALTYRETQVGAWMTRQIISLPVDSDVRAATDLLNHSPQTTQIYLTDEARSLAGVVPVAQMLAVSPGERLAELADRTAPSLHISTPVARAIVVSGWDDYLRLPVIDANRILAGDISRRALRSALEQQGRGSSRETTSSILGEISTAYAATAMGLLDLAAPSTGVKAGEKR